MVSQQILSTVMTYVVVKKKKYRPRLTTFDLFYTTILKITKEIFVKIC